MTSVDFNIPFDGAYHAVTMIGTSMIVFNKTGTDILFRYGVVSTSSGIPLESNQVVSVSETIYVKVPIEYAGDTSSLKIVVSQ
jgi:hypothetical protein